ncbi:MAG: hypothetical protein M3437_07065 [Chloroflexota bacterium]|nr:hypothetical protein [Chloroflexota bacterium]
MLFPEGDDLPLFSGTPQQVLDQPFVPEDHIFKQQVFPGMPGLDYDHIREKDREQQRQKRRGK